MARRSGGLRLDLGATSQMSFLFPSPMAITSSMPEDKIPASACVSVPIRAGIRAIRALSGSSRAPATSISRKGVSGQPGESRYAPAMMRKNILVAATLALAWALGAPALHAFEQREAPSGFTPKPLVKAKRHMVVAAHPLAAEAGLAILRKGGSAVDAAIATQMVLNLVEPQSSGIGGGGFFPFLGHASKTLALFRGGETGPAPAV